MTARGEEEDRGPKMGDAVGGGVPRKTRRWNAILLRVPPRARGAVASPPRGSF
jgi:hypothetical protein